MSTYKRLLKALFPCLFPLTCEGDLEDGYSNGSWEPLLLIGAVLLICWIVVSCNMEIANDTPDLSKAITQQEQVISTQTGITTYYGK
jgi:hypothetical protein